MPWSSEKHDELLFRAHKVVSEINAATGHSYEIETDIAEDGALSMVIHSGSNDYLVVPCDTPDYWTMVRISSFGEEILRENVPLEVALQTWGKEN